MIYKEGKNIFLINAEGVFIPFFLAEEGNIGCRLILSFFLFKINHLVY